MLMTHMFIYTLYTHTSVSALYDSFIDILWMEAIKLKQNPDKTNIIIIGIKTTMK